MAYLPAFWDFFFHMDSVECFSEDISRFLVCFYECLIGYVIWSQAFFPFQFFLWLFLIPCGVICSGSSVVCSAAWSAFFTSVAMYFVQFSYSGVPGLAWYRSSKYSAMCFFVFSGSVMVVPSSVMVA